MGIKPQPNTPLIEWMRSRHVDSGMSMEDLSVASGARKAWLSAVLNRGSSVTGAYLAGFCRAIGLPPLKGFVVAGWITEDEANQGTHPPDAMAVTDEEIDLLRAFREAEPLTRQSTLAVARVREPRRAQSA